MKYIQQSLRPDQVRRDGRADPTWIISIPSLVDSTLAPEGQHTLSATVQYAPYRIEGSWDADKRSRLLETVLSTLGDLRSRYSKEIDHRQSVVFPPADLEELATDCLRAACITPT